MFIYVQETFLSENIPIFAQFLFSNFFRYSGDFRSARQLLKQAGGQSNLKGRFAPEN